MPIVLPAVDIRGGRCVRLLQGRPDEETVYDDRPADAARRWADLGAEFLHVVDLDGAFQGHPVNGNAIAEIIEAVDVPVEVGGGLRTTEAVRRTLDLGVTRVIVGSRALRDPEWVKELCEAFPDQVVAGIDARDGRVAVEGWAEVSDVDAVDFAQQLDAFALRAMAFTDVATDGMMAGPNVAALQRLAEAVDTPVIASGGIASLDHVRRVAAVGVEGMIIGKALFVGALSLPDAIAAARQE
jgi:phosphoribosylformimino-5-aminoimidazole carboxamide ribotide isomerase